MSSQSKWYQFKNYQGIPQDNSFYTVFRNIVMKKVHVGILWNYTITIIYYLIGVSVLKIKLDVITSGIHGRKDHLCLPQPLHWPSCEAWYCPAWSCWTCRTLLEMLGFALRSFLMLWSAPSTKPGYSASFPEDIYPRFLSLGVDVLTYGPDLLPQYWGWFLHATGVPSVLKWEVLVNCRVAVNCPHRTNRFSVTLPSQSLIKGIWQGYEAVKCLLKCNISVKAQNSFLFLQSNRGQIWL